MPNSPEENNNMHQDERVSTKRQELFDLGRALAIACGIRPVTPVLPEDADDENDAEMLQGIYAQEAKEAAEHMEESLKYLPADEERYVRWCQMFYSSEL